MGKKPNAEAFLAAMQGQGEPDEAVAAHPPPPAREAPKAPAERRPAGNGKTKPSRSQLKHFGGYVDDETLEKIALLRIRLKKDNSELITHAIDELHRKHGAKRAFGDA